MRTRCIIWILGIFVVLVTSCIPRKPYVYSSAWIKAAESTAHYEMTYTNGMDWPPNTSSNEVVMHKGESIVAETPSSKIVIEAGQGFWRSYTWDGGTRSESLWPRRQRWYGSLGVYFPGPGQHWRSNHGITRGVLEEGVLWFKTTNDAVNWLQNVQPLKNCVYSKSGLIVAWEKVLERKQLNVDVWQLMIGGTKPTDLSGGHDDQIRVIK